MTFRKTKMKLESPPAVPPRVEKRGKYRFVLHPDSIEMFILDIDPEGQFFFRFEYRYYSGFHISQTVSTDETYRMLLDVVFGGVK